MDIFADGGDYTTAGRRRFQVWLGRLRRVKRQGGEARTHRSSQTDAHAPLSVQQVRQAAFVQGGPHRKMLDPIQGKHRSCTRCSILQWWQQHRRFTVGTASFWLAHHFCQQPCASRMIGVSRLHRISCPWAPSLKRHAQLRVLLLDVSLCSSSVILRAPRGCNA